MPAKSKYVGFPRMVMEAGELRVFLPEFIQQLTQLGFEVFIEEGYGSRSGFTFDDYQLGNPLVYICSRQEAFQQDIVIILRSPRKEDFELIPKGTCLISMLHYPTRPERIKKLLHRGIRAISLDSIVDDNNIRMIENMHAVAWNGLEAAFNVLENQFPSLMRDDGAPWHVLVLGTGMVGKYAVDAAVKLGNIERYNDHIHHEGPGGVAISVGRSLTCKPEWMERLFRNTDVLVDATQRREPSKPVVPNAWLAWLPPHAVVVDLSVDPYLLDNDPPTVRGIEGIPIGNLDKYVFLPEDSDWGLTVPGSIPSQERRTTITCYSWPGIHPEACMRHYSRQLYLFMEVLAEKDYDELSLSGKYFERALCRATLREWISSKQLT
jgi:alanine dehydrogenase